MKSLVIEHPRDCRSLFCGMGVYVLTQSAISDFRSALVDPLTGERGITSGLQAAIEAGIQFSPVPFDGYYNNINTPADYIAAELHLATRAGCPVRTGGLT